MSFSGLKTTEKVRKDLAMLDSKTNQVRFNVLTLYSLLVLSFANSASFGFSPESKRKLEINFKCPRYETTRALHSAWTAWDRLCRH